MQVKVCPKCKRENKATNAVCISCYASIEEIVPTKSAGQPAPTQPPAPKPPRVPAAAPAQTQQMPPVEQTQMGTNAPPPGMPGASSYQVMQPVKRKSAAWLIALIIIIGVAAISGMAFLVASQLKILKPAMPTEPPEKTVLAFLEAKKSGQLSRVEPYLSKESIDTVLKAFGNRQFKSAGFTKKESADMFIFNVPPKPEDLVSSRIVASVVKDDPEADERMQIVSVIVERVEPPAAPQPLLPPGVTPPPPDRTKELTATFSKMFGQDRIATEFVVVNEGGQWKIDISEMARRTLGLGKPGNPFKLGK